jgi:hypothetical protein
LFLPAISIKYGLLLAIGSPLFRAPHAIVWVFSCSKNMRGNNSLTWSRASMCSTWVVSKTANLSWTSEIAAYWWNKNNCRLSLIIYCIFCFFKLVYKIQKLYFNKIHLIRLPSVARDRLSSEEGQKYIYAQEQQLYCYDNSLRGYGIFANQNNWKAQSSEQALSPLRCGFQSRYGLVCKLMWRVCQCSAESRWFSPGAPVSFQGKVNRAG